MNKVDKLRESTYNEVLEMLQTYGKCAVIRPTGFGKTGMLTRIIKERRYKKILYLYPSQVVKNKVLEFFYGRNSGKDTIDNVIFMTYKALTMLGSEEIQALSDVDLIISDECHKLGATETMRGLTYLLAVNTTTHLLGATATPERMDMIDEIAIFFEDRVTSRYTLHDAFQDKIIQKPYYCFCGFGESDPKRLAKIKKDAMLQTEFMLDRQYAQDLVNARMLEIAKLSKMEYVIEETLKEAKMETSYQKYIVFFCNFEHLHTAQNRVKGWFKSVFPKHQINELIVTSETNEYHNNTEELDKLSYKANTIDLIYTCDMMDCGYHVEDLTGILMYRGTYSNTVYSQQLGRALSTGDITPRIVFDIVDNLHRKSVYSLLGEDVISNPNLTAEEMQEYVELVNRTRDKDINGVPVPLTVEETRRLLELSKLIKKRNDETLGKVGCNTIYQTDLIVTKYEATYRELIAKTVAEPISMRCRQAWNRWLEKGGDATIRTREYILGQQAPNAVPLSPFCKLKNVSVNAVLNEMGIA